MKVSELIKGISCEIINGSVDTEIVDVFNDSREVVPSSLFFCITGSVRDGHDFVEDVVKKGAKALVVEKEVKVPEDVCVIKVENSRYAMGMISSVFYGEPSKKLTVVGITGTKGKTTTTYMIQAMLNAAGHKAALVGTIESIIGDVHTPSNNTTPESIKLQRMMKEMVDKGHDSLVMEVSSQGLMLDRVAGVDFDYGIFTNLSEDHIGPNEHQSFEEYMMWKGKLFTLCKHGIFNADDPYYKGILDGHTCDVVTYGMERADDYRATAMELYSTDGSLGVEYDLSGLMNAHVLVNLPGKFSVYNSLAAIALTKAMGVPEETILEILKTITVKGRVELIPISDKFTIMIDYAHNAVSLESILTTLRAYEPGRLISLFGCGGNRSRTRRFEMGEVSGNLADLTIITSDNPRNEEPQAIIDDIKTGISKTSGHFVEIIDRKEAIRYAIMNAKENDVIVLAGKGHEDYQEICGVKHHMDERDLIREILEEEDVSKICGYNNRYFA